MLHQKKFEFDESNIEDISSMIDTQIKSWENMRTPSGVMHEVSVTVNNIATLPILILNEMHHHKKGIVIVSFYVAPTIDNDITNNISL